MKISQQSRVLNGAGDLKKAVLPHNSPWGVCTYLKSLFVQFRASPVSSASALLHIQNQGATWQVFPQYSPLVSSSYLGFKLTNRLLQPTMNVPLTPNSPCPDTLISSAFTGNCSQNSDRLVPHRPICHRQHWCAALPFHWWLYWIFNGGNCRPLDMIW